MLEIGLGASKYTPQGELSLCTIERDQVCSTAHEQLTLPYGTHLIPFYSTQADLRLEGMVRGHRSDLHHVSDFACKAQAP